MGNSVNFFSEGSNLEFPSDKNALSYFIEWIIENERLKTGEINIIVCDDAYLCDINKQYLHRDYFTDVISFDNSDEKDVIVGDVFVSLDRVKDNAQKYDQSVENEFNRVVFHGVLHLVGYKDINKDDKELMREKENYYLEQYVSRETK